MAIFNSYVKLPEGKMANFCHGMCSIFSNSQENGCSWDLLRLPSAEEKCTKGIDKLGIDAAWKQGPHSIGL